MLVQPTYTPANCSPAFQLNWSLSVFGKRGLPSPELVMSQLEDAVSKDELRILEFRMLQPNVAQFFISSRPNHSPSSIVRSLKGRWQYAAREFGWISFRRNYYIASVGSANAEVLDSYVARQNAKHPMADTRIQDMLQKLQFHDPAVEPAEVRRGTYGEYAYGLQVVLENEDNWNETRVEVLDAYRRMILGTCQKHDWPLSRIGVLSNHLHILLSARVEDTPESVALALMNNIAYTQGSRPVLRYSYYVGTFGTYDRGAIWNALKSNHSGAL